MSLCFKCCNNPCSCYYDKLEKDYQVVQHKLKIATDALEVVSDYDSSGKDFYYGKIAFDARKALEKINTHKK